MKSDSLQTRVLLMRHAETAAPDLFHGAESDVGLGRNGAEQACRVGRAIRDGEWHDVPKSPLILSSGQWRARGTAMLILAGIGPGGGGCLSLRLALHERIMGPMSGMEKLKGWPIYEETKARWMAGDLDFTHEGGESYAAIRDRVVPVFAEVAQSYRRSTIVIVCHGIVIRVFLTSVIPGLSPADFDRISLQYVTPHDLVWNGDSWQANRIAWEPSSS